MKAELIYGLTEAFEGHAQQTGGEQNFALIRSKGDNALFNNYWCAPGPRR